MFWASPKIIQIHFQSIFRSNLGHMNIVVNKLDQPLPTPPAPPVNPPPPPSSIHSNQVPPHLQSLYNPRHPASSRPSDNSSSHHSTNNYSLQQNQYEVPHLVRYGPVYNDQQFTYGRNPMPQHSGHYWTVMWMISFLKTNVDIHIGLNLFKKCVSTDELWWNKNVLACWLKGENIVVISLKCKLHCINYISLIELPNLWPWKTLVNMIDISSIALHNNFYWLNPNFLF
jgi:hypothetical protein